MTLDDLIPLVLKTSVMMMIFAMRLTAVPADLLHLLRRPSKLLRSLVSMYGVMLIVSVAICKVIAPSKKRS